ncbi:transcriptional regulator [Syntrophobotulus glycolicus DSM 8271]|uniref:Transcriptional regulator CtsR n=1 Tax=Syntrophobotulus glycolicus (strain DSM 8271 / FlGlyR) TaxID=645991 RepID=F0SWX0_SYNGF|nr:CtsR family transcriptional regulator [Syntrophobotulus glycolicus]ADY54660.1 transcriptional regulator [Syntrophobotulus glycolicus DSM 8271]
MRNLADRIEEYIKKTIGQAQEDFIVLQRGFLAEIFSCAPSQINYVLTTRFTAEKGYLVESRRGGGGYLRIVRLGLDPEGKFQRLMSELIGDRLSQDRAFDLISRLEEEEIFTRREAAIIKSIFTDKILEPYVNDQSSLRARLMKDILANLCREDIKD